jgi:hypothetical protein
MKHLLTAGALALTTLALASIAGCNQQQPQQAEQAPGPVIEKETTVVHDQPVIVRQDGGHPDGDHRAAPPPADRRDTPPPADHPADRQDNRH